MEIATVIVTCLLCCLSASFNCSASKQDAAPPTADEEAVSTTPPPPTTPPAGRDCGREAAFDEERGECRCLDPEKKWHADGACLCDPLLCHLPQLCDKRSVAVQVQEECCKRTVCVPCPQDSESTMLQMTADAEQQLEDHCVCLPCRKECAQGETVIVKKKASGFPGDCCDIYECQPTKTCNVGGDVYRDGETWKNDDGTQLCVCVSGVSRCSATQPVSSSSLPCFVNQKWYSNGDNWTEEDGCTLCTCTNGDLKCISHFCQVKEGHRNVSDEIYCIDQGRVYLNREKWTEKDGCQDCVCQNGTKLCTAILSNCAKTCRNGFTTDDRGCQICECNDVNEVNNVAASMTAEILSKYNISVTELIKILDEYHNKRKVNQNETWTFSASWWPYVITTVTTVCFLCACVYVYMRNKRRRSSLDLTTAHYDYRQVNNNNNVIKKTDQLL